MYVCMCEHVNLYIYMCVRTRIHTVKGGEKLTEWKWGREREKGREQAGEQNREVERGERGRETESKGGRDRERACARQRERENERERERERGRESMRERGIHTQTHAYKRTHIQTHTHTHTHEAHHPRHCRRRQQKNSASSWACHLVDISNVSSTGILHNWLSGKLTFENFYRPPVPCPLVSSFAILMCDTYDPVMACTCEWVMYQCPIGWNYIEYNNTKKLHECSFCVISAAYTNDDSNIW